MAAKKKRPAKAPANGGNGAGANKKAVRRLTRGPFPLLHNAAGFIGEDPQSAQGLSERWKIIWPATIALAWKDADFKAKLLAGPNQAKEAIRLHFQFAVPDALTLVIMDALDGEGEQQPMKATVPIELDVPTVRYNALNRDWEFPAGATTLHLFIPTAPEDEADRAVALAAYVGEGFGDGFTCCC